MYPIFRVPFNYLSAFLFTFIYFSLHLSSLPFGKTPNFSACFPFLLAISHGRGLSGEKEACQLPTSLQHVISADEATATVAGPGTATTTTENQANRMGAEAQSPGVGLGVGGKGK